MDFHFLIASERSGSNLITKMLDAHPEVCGPSPLHILRVLGMEYYRYGDLSVSSNWDVLLDDVYTLLSSDFAKWKSSVTREQIAEMAAPGDLPSLLRSVFENEARANGKNALFIKELWTHKYISFLDWCFPGAKFVYLVRDPRDMALSWRNNEVHPGGVVAGARQWTTDQSSTAVSFGPLHRAGRAIVVRYEDLVSDSSKSLKKICGFLGIDYSDKMLAFHKNQLTQHNADKNPLWKNLSKEVMSDNFNKFKNELTPFEIAAIEVICWPTLRYFGYKPETSVEELRQVKQAQIKEFAEKERQKYPPKSQVRVHDEIQARLRKRYVRFHDL